MKMTFHVRCDWLNCAAASFIPSQQIQASQRNIIDVATGLRVIILPQWTKIGAYLKRKIDIVRDIWHRHRVWIESFESRTTSGAWNKGWGPRVPSLLQCHALQIKHPHYRHKSHGIIYLLNPLVIIFEWWFVLRLTHRDVRKSILTFE